jgi:ABC-type glycerol-3-phosphate transport system substrate-binding protein
VEVQPARSLPLKRLTKPGRLGAASVPGTARNEKVARDFIKFLLSAEGQNILKDTGQPPVVPAIRKGDVPAELR